MPGSSSNNAPRDPRVAPSGNAARSGAVAPAGRWWKAAIFLVLALAALVLAWQLRDQFRLENLVRHKQRILGLRAEQPVLVYGAAFVLYALVTGLSIPGAAALTMFYGAVFGFVPTLVIVSFASTAGATLAFLSSRYLLRDAVQHRFAAQLERFNRAWEREGAYYLFTLRLIPLAPFFVVNLVMGLTPIRVRTYWWVSQLGMLPGTCAYVYAGTQLAPERLQAPGFPWQLALAFCILGLLPLVLKRLAGRRAGKE